MHRGAAQRLDAGDVGMAADAASGDQRHPAFQAGAAQEGQRLGNAAREVEARVVQVGDLGRAQVAAGQARVLQHDGVGQALLALPLLHHQGHAAGVAEDGHQQRLGMLDCEVGQVQRQAGAHHHHVGAGFQRRTHIGRVIADGAHHVHRHQAVATGDGQRSPHLAAHGLQVGGIDLGPAVVVTAHALRQVAGAFHQVRVVAAQVDRAERAHAAQRRHAAGQAVGRHAHAHAALHDGQQPAPAQHQRLQAAAGQLRLQVGRNGVRLGRWCGHGCRPPGGRGRGKTAGSLRARPPRRLDADQGSPRSAVLHAQEPQPAPRCPWSSIAR